MSASLVGSEMCIRDRAWRVPPPPKPVDEVAGVLSTFGDGDGLDRLPFSEGPGADLRPPAPRGVPVCLPGGRGPFSLATSALSLGGVEAASLALAPVGEPRRPSRLPAPGDASSTGSP
eukprot:15467421-Alexandrium_andersonii.AAC.1